MINSYKDVNVECRMCNGAVESLEHLCLYCPVAQNFLFASPLNFRTNGRLNLSVQHYIKSWLLEGVDFAKLGMGACLFIGVYGKPGIMSSSIKARLTCSQCCRKQPFSTVAIQLFRMQRLSPLNRICLIQLQLYGPLLLSQRPRLILMVLLVPRGSPVP